MPRFGVFFIPPARSPFYRLGTSILGYDVRRGQDAHQDNFIRAQLPDFDEAYVKRPQKHGIHCTIVAPQTCRYGDLDTINYEIERILNCFSESSIFEMSAKSEFVTYWGKKQQIAVLQYQANPGLLMLHTLLVSQLVKYAIATGDAPAQDSEPHEYHRIKNFNTPFVFDGFTPHFTLLFPYRGDKHDEMQDLLYALFGQFKKQLVDNICLMVQSEKDEKWFIHKEYSLVDYPQVPDS